MFPRKQIVCFIILSFLTTAGCLKAVHTPEGSTSLPAPADTATASQPLLDQPATENKTLDTPSTPNLIPNATSTASVKSIEQQITPKNLSEGKPTPSVSAETFEAGTATLETPPPVEKKPETILDEALDYCQLSQNLWQQGELDSALEALDQAYALILGLQDIEADPKLIQQKEDLRFLISKRILEIYASRHIVVNGDYNAIPIEINRHVQAEIDRFTKGIESDFFKAAYKRSGRYRPYIVKELKNAGLPEELSWIPLIESGYKVRALSKARALGLWQFIPSTGYKFGLTRNTYVDNRMDPSKSTQAAIAYLKELHQIFGDWATVLAAYNCGEGRVLRVIRSQKINYLDNFWDLYEKLPRETARYVPRFIATLHIMQDPAKYGLDTVVVDPPIQYETATISKRIHLKQVAKAINVSQATLKTLNPELRYQITPPEPYALKVPPGIGSTLLTAIADIPAYRPPQPKYVYHRVRRGESVSSIASRYHTSVSRIARANRLNRHYTIVAGKTLKIPVKGSSVGPSSKSRKRVAATTHHKVRKGDSLWNIARRYGTTVNNIKRLNGLKGSTLSTGQVLKIAGTAKAPPPSRKELKPYRVKSGDSPYQIAKRNQMSLAYFLQVNRLTPRSKIYPGQKVYIE
jgi:membrane-bound lytic murein transglycosylase D